MSEQVTSGLEWRKPREEGYLKELPSGNWARLRPVTPDMLLVTGEIPDILTPLVMKMLFEGIDNKDLEVVTKPENMLEHAKETIDFFNSFCKLAFVEPKIVDNPRSDDEMHILDVTVEDRGFVFQLCIQPVEVLRSFRLESARNVDALPESGEVQPDTKQPDSGA